MSAANDHTSDTRIRVVADSSISRIIIIQISKLKSFRESEARVSLWMRGNAWQ